MLESPSRRSSHNVITSKLNNDVTCLHLAANNGGSPVVVRAPLPARSSASYFPRSPPGAIANHVSSGSHLLIFSVPPRETRPSKGSSRFTLVSAGYSI